jgi:uncharacterized protein (DUF433 family)
MQDFRLALRTIRSTPVVTTVAIVSLALGIGASTAIFALVNSLVLRTLPVAEPQRLVTVSTGPAELANIWATISDLRTRGRMCSRERPMRDADLLARITIDPEQCGGRPCIRGIRIGVVDVLQLLAAGETPQQILAEYPYLEPDDIAASLLYAARQLDHPVLAA